MRLFQKTPSFKPFQTSHDTHLSLNGAKVTKFSLSYTRNGYTWIDLPTVYEATATLWIAKGPNGVGGRKTQRMFWQSLLLRGGIFLNHSPPPQKKNKKHLQSRHHWKCGYTISPRIFVEKCERSWWPHRERCFFCLVGAFQLQGIISTPLVTPLVLWMVQKFG